MSQTVNVWDKQLTDDSAMMLIDTWLQIKGATSGVTREEVISAFDYLTSPLVNRAVRLGIASRSIAITCPQDLEAEH